MKIYASVLKSGCLSVGCQILIAQVMTMLSISIFPDYNEVKGGRRIPKKRVIINLGRRKITGIPIGPQNKFCTPIGPSKFILMTFF